MRLRTKSLLTLGELSKKEFAGLLADAARLKRSRRPSPRLRGRTLAMIFEKPSTRTRISFEAGMYQMGGHAINLPAGDLQLSRGESVEDTARTLSRYADCVMARVYDHRMLESLAAHSSIPVINGLSDSFHPCQILADFMTIRERLGRTRGVRIAWIGDGNNVCNSMVYGAALAGAEIAVATPAGMAPDPAAVREASRETRVDLVRDPREAVAGAHVVVTDTHSSIHDRGRSRARRLAPYRVDSALMGAAHRDAIFMHCLPATRGREVTAAVIDGPRSAVWDEAENRLHTQKALLAAMIGA